MNNKGFTLVEVLAVITIIAIISSAAMLSYNGINSMYQKNECKQRRTMLETKAVQYAEEHNIFDNVSTDSLTKNISEWDFLRDEEISINPKTNQIFKGKLTITKRGNGLYKAVYINPSSGDECE